jgi:hypothetical protein
VRRGESHQVARSLDHVDRRERGAEQRHDALERELVELLQAGRRVQRARDLAHRRQLAQRELRLRGRLVGDLRHGALGRRRTLEVRRQLQLARGGRQRRRQRRGEEIGLGSGGNAHGSWGGSGGARRCQASGGNLGRGSPPH